VTDINSVLRGPSLLKSLALVFSSEFAVDGACRVMQRVEDSRQRLDMQALPIAKCY